MLRWIGLSLGVVVVTIAVSLGVLYAPAPESPALRPTVAGPAGPEGPPPKLEVVGPRIYDFGMMPQHAKGVHSWQIKNDGAGILELWLEATTCSCTIAKLKNEVG